MEVCRIIKAEKLEDINFDNLGIHWTTNPEKCCQKLNHGNATTFWIYAEIDESMIWDDYTRQDLDDFPSLNTNRESGEFEVTLRPGTEIIIDEVYDEDQICVMSQTKAAI